ncbi:MAG: translation initiation inhibitor [Verrucomicrobiota bacterium]|jgi:enamine deaminase RidA (YjgF/YER057c/UK114 family)
MKNADADTLPGTSNTAYADPDFFIAVKPLPGEGLKELFSRLARTLKDEESALVNLMIFGSIKAHEEAEEAMRRVFGRIEWPVTWVEGAAGDDHAIAGMQALAFSAGQVTPIRLDGRVAGCTFETGGIRHCLLGGLGPETLSARRPDQLRQTLGSMETAFGLAGYSLGDLVRTWFHLDDLLSWYGPFNEARTEVYSSIRFRTGSLPASTGVSARNPAGAALSAGAWAMQPLHAAAKIAEVASPLQCPAPAYGSSFSRAMEISSLQGRRLLISGTASIAPGGETLGAGDLPRQMDLSMDVVEAILTSRGFGFSDITRATAYFKNREDIPAFAAWCADRGLLSLPFIAAQCGICRDELLFELEADAWKAAP